LFTARELAWLSWPTEIYVFQEVECLFNVRVVAAAGYDGTIGERSIKKTDMVNNFFKERGLDRNTHP
jgi:hypothetical protein